MSKIDQREIELIKAFVLKKPREFFIAHPEYQVSKLASEQVNKLIKKRTRGIPLAYLLGKKEFFGLNFTVNKNVLIPRPETELMVEKVLQKIKNSKNQEIILIDIGTGTGCIPISIIKTINPTLPSPTRGGKGRGFAVFATDISQPALSVAKKNAKKHNVKIKFLHGNLLEPFLCHPEFISGSFPKSNLLKSISGEKMLKQVQHDIIITANLPYLTPQQLKQEPSIKHEPHLALVAGKDGLKYYRELLKQINILTSDYRLQTTVFCEINPEQTKNIKLLTKKILPQAKITLHQDLAGKNRVVEIIPL